MSLLFTGYYGQFNTGDDIFCVISDWAARKFWKQDKVKFLGRNLPMRLDGSALKSGIKKKNYIKGQFYLEVLLQGILNTKIVYSGGSLFHSEVKGFKKDNIFKQYQKKGLIQLGAVGVSLGPYRSTNARNSIKAFLSAFSFLALRDRRSFEDAMEMQLPIQVVEAFDLAALLPLIYPISKIENKDPVLGVSICNYESFVNGDLKKEKNRYKKILGCINRLVKRIPNLQIKILVFNAHPIVGDIDLSNKMKQNIPDKINVERVDYNRNPYHMWRSISQCDAVLSTRLHAGIFSCFSETPFIQIEYHKKCSDFLNDVGYMDDFRIGDFEATEQEVSDKLIELLGQSTFFIKNLKVCQKKALLNFTSFGEYFLEK